MLLYWHLGNHAIAVIQSKETWEMWVNRSHEFIKIDNITTKALRRRVYFVGYTAELMSVAPEIAIKDTDK